MATVLLLFFSLSLQAQIPTDAFTETDKAFFETQKASIEKWLGNIGLGNDKITEIKLQTTPNFVVLRLRVANAETWLSIRQSYADSNQNRRIEEEIFDKLVAWCEVNPKQAQVVITDVTNYEVKGGIDLKLNKFVVEESNKPRGYRLEVFKLPKYKVIPNPSSTAFDEFEGTRKKIIVALQKFYQDKENVKFQVLLDLDNKIYIRVTNLKKEIIYDKLFGDFEQILISVDLLKAGKYITIVCGVDGKHSSNFFTAPRTLTGYKDMGSNGYQAYINEYAQKITTYLAKNMR